MSATHRWAGFLSNIAVHLLSLLDKQMTDNPAARFVSWSRLAQTSGGVSLLTDDPNNRRRAGLSNLCLRTRVMPTLLPKQGWKQQSGGLILLHHTQQVSLLLLPCVRALPMLALKRKMCRSASLQSCQSRSAWTTAWLQSFLDTEERNKILLLNWILTS